MAGVLVRLRLAIRRGSRENTAQRLWFVLSWLLGLGAGLAGGAFVAGADAARDGRGDLTVLTVFTVIFLAWVVSRAVWLMAAGVVLIYAGVCCIAVGAVCLAVYLWRSWRAGAAPRRRIAWQALGVLALYLVNFVAAGGAVFGAIMIETRYTVSITNHSSVALESAQVAGGGVCAEFGNILPGATVKRSFWIENDGELVLTGTHGTRKVDATVDGYVTSNFGADLAVVLKTDGTVSTTDKRRRDPD